MALPPPVAGALGVTLRQVEERRFTEVNSLVTPVSRFTVDRQCLIEMFPRQAELSGFPEVHSQVPEGDALRPAVPDLPVGPECLPVGHTGFFLPPERVEDIP